LESRADYRHGHHLLVENPEATEEQLRNRDLWARPS
jgi:hypothetical protein